jgi:hypothetical protein
MLEQMEDVFQSIHFVDKPIQSANVLHAILAIELIQEDVLLHHLPMLIVKVSEVNSALNVFKVSIIIKTTEFVRG